MIERLLYAPLGAIILAGLSCGAAHAQSATPGSTTTLEPIVISGGQDTKEAAAERLKALAGGVAIVSPQDQSKAAVPTVSDALSAVPGVVVQKFFGGNDQPRIQIRGSGLQQNPVERGVLILRDGLPINRADGSYIVGLANPGASSLIEVYRGYTVNRLGASVLGGAINFVSPVEEGTRINAGGGSLGRADLSAETGYKWDRFAAAIHVDGTRRDGFRNYNSSDRVNIGGTVEAEISDIVKTRFFANYTRLNFDIPGPISRSALQQDPEQVSPGPPLSLGPNVLRDRPRRESEQYLIGSRTTIDLGEHLFDIGLGYTYTEDMFRFPIASGVRSTDGGDATTSLRYAYQPDASSLLPLFEATAIYSFGSADRSYHLNQDGKPGAAFARNDLDSSSLSLHAGLNIPLTDELILSPSLGYTHAERDNKDRWKSATRPTLTYTPTGPVLGTAPAIDTSYNRDFNGWSPSLGLSWHVNENHMLFAAVSRTFEPPTQDDLFGTSGGTPNGSPTGFSTPDLDAQTATTIEAGWRGALGDWSFDAVTYYSWVDNELLSLRDASGSPLSAVNAGRTTHFGIELGITAQITDALSARLAYTYQDFRFDNDPVRGNNRLAGAPPHVIEAALDYAITEQWSVGTKMHWLPQETPVDNMHTMDRDSYALFDVSMSYDINENLSLYGEVTNIFDKTYASSSLIVDQAAPNQAVFQSGDGRAFYAGLKARF